MKSICKNCAQREVGCTKPCADRRIEIADRKERIKRFAAAVFGEPREQNREASTWK